MLRGWVVSVSLVQAVEGFLVHQSGLLLAAVVLVTNYIRTYIGVQVPSRSSVHFTP